MIELKIVSCNTRYFRWSVRNSVSVQSVFSIEATPSNLVAPTTSRTTNKHFTKSNHNLRDCSKLLLTHFSHDRVLEIRSIELRNTDIKINKEVGILKPTKTINKQFARMI